MNIRTSLLAGIAALCLSLTAAQAQPRTIKIGVLNDMSTIYTDVSGKGSVVAAQLAAEDFIKENPAYKVEILSGDHQNKPDIGSTIVRRWIDVDHIDAVVDVPTSSVVLAINTVLRDANKVFLASSAATSDLTGKFCSPNTVQWVFDTWSQAHGTAAAIMKQGYDTWFFVAADFALGDALIADTRPVVEKLGGRVVGIVRPPLNTPDQSSFLLQAQASGAKVVALMNAGGDVINAIKQAHEFGLTDHQKLAAMLVFITDIESVGLRTAQGLLLTAAFYWDLNDDNRAFAKRFAAAGMTGRVPTMNHAGVYSSTLAYLRAVAAIGGVDGVKVVEQMKRTPVDDKLFGHVVIRPDGRAVHDMYLFQVKTPTESKGPWDDYKLVATIPAAEAFRPLAEGGCALVK